MALTDESKIAFGKHQGTMLKDVPASYLLWLMDQHWFYASIISYNVALKEYIQDNLQVLKKEVEDGKGKQ